MSGRFTRRYFFDQLLEFRGLMGSREFWTRSQEQRDTAIKALGFVYINADLKPEDISTFVATMAEYQRREFYAIALS